MYTPANDATTDLNGTWHIDGTHSRFGFTVRHAMVTKVRGAFNDVSGHIVVDLDDPARSRATVTMKAASIDTRNPERDAHLRSADFFAVEEYPDIVFTSTRIEEADDNAYIVIGELTIKDVTKPLSIPLAVLGIDRDHMGVLRAGFEGHRRIDRREWDVRWNQSLDSGGILISDKVNLEFELSLVKDEGNNEQTHEGEQPREGEQPHEGEQPSQPAHDGDNHVA